MPIPQRVRFRMVFAAGVVASAVAVWAQGGSIATERIFDALGLQRGLTVCEIGAGNGDLSLAAARVVGPAGRVFTSELGDERVKALGERIASGGLAHVTVVAGDPVKTNFPDAACDALFMRNVYHHFADPAAMNVSMAAALKPGARLAIVDFTPPATEAERPSDRAATGCTASARRPCHASSRPPTSSPSHRRRAPGAGSWSSSGNPGPDGAPGPVALSVNQSRPASGRASAPTRCRAGSTSSRRRSTRRAHAPGRRDRPSQS